MTKYKPPLTKKIPTEETLFGRRIEDDYRWLENVDDPKVQAWIDEQNKYTDRFIDEQAKMDSWLERTEPFGRITRRSAPIKKGDRLFYARHDADQDYKVIYVADLDGKNERAVLDINKSEAKGMKRLETYIPSPDGKLLAYGLSQDGKEIPVLHVIDVESGKELPDTVENFSNGFNWFDDETGFYYSKRPKPGEVPDNDLRMYEKVYQHTLGTNTDDDELIFGEDLHKEDWTYLSRTKGAPYLRIEVGREWTRNDVYLMDIKTNEVVDFITGYDEISEVVPMPDRLLIHTTIGAKNGRLLVARYEDIGRPVEEFKTLIPESDAVLSFVSYSKSRIFAGYLRDASEEVLVYDYDGNLKGKVPAPDIAIVDISSSVQLDDVYVNIHNMVLPGSMYKLDAKELKPELFYEVKAPHNPDDYVVKREWAASKDGTKLPVFIIHRKDLKLDGARPTILYGYGGFGNSETPEYIGTLMAWVMAGGVYADSVIRGGGEYGEQWHQAGIKEHKQTSFDDFIAHVENLIAKNYTDRDHLAIYGGSNGGLLVGAVATQRPELAGSVVCAVPLLDMIHFHRLLIASRWMSEYGDPDKKEDFERIMSWSPYHNVDPAKPYPAMYLMTAENDTRVHPMHAMKMAAKLQSTQRPALTILEVQRGAGHAGDKPRSQAIVDSARRIAFMASQTGLELT